MTSPIWPVDKTGLPELPELDPSSPSPEFIKAARERNAAMAIATEIMYRLSGSRFGLSTTVARPCPRGTFPDPAGIGSYTVTWTGAAWRGLACGCAPSCRLGGPSAVHLPGPVFDVISVEIAGAVLATNVWTVEGNVLYRRDGKWPGQDLGKPLGQQGTWSVTYERSVPVPLGVAELTGLLTAEILAALNNDGKCRLPRTVTTVTRQGVTYRAYDPAVIYANGKTGIPEIDLWLTAVNPHRLMSAPSVL